MKRTSLIAAAALIAVASTAVIATANIRGDGDGPRDGRGGPAMMFERFDTNGDGQITREEAEAAAAAHFTEADGNGDGQLSAEELTAAAEARRAERESLRRASRIEQMIERRDTNGDGMLSLEEMTAQAGRGGGMDRMFDMLDADDDGIITKAEAEMAGDKRGHGRWGKRGGHSGRN